MGWRAKPLSNTPRPPVTPAPQQGYPAATREELVEVLRSVIEAIGDPEMVHIGYGHYFERYSVTYFEGQYNPIDLARDVLRREERDE